MTHAPSSARPRGSGGLTLEDAAAVTSAAGKVATAVAVLETRYRPARENPNRVGIEITVQRFLGHV